MRWIRLRKPRRPQNAGCLYGQPLGSIKTKKLHDALGRHNLPMSKLREIQAELRIRLETETRKPKKEGVQFERGRLYGQPITSIKTPKLEKALGRFEVKSVEYKAISQELNLRSQGGDQ